MALAFFVSGTDTGVGKTWVTGLLARHYLSQNLRVVTQKWVQTGAGTDVVTHWEIMGVDPILFRDDSRNISPYSFSFPASPHLAAESEGQVIYLDILAQAYQRLTEKYDVVICEGSGGICSPLSRTFSQDVLVKKLNLPVVLVIPSRLGCLNQAALSVSFLKAANIPLAGSVLVNLEPDLDPKIHADHGVYLSSGSEFKLRCQIPYFVSLTEAKAFRFQNLRL